MRIAYADSNPSQIDVALHPPVSKEPSPPALAMPSLASYAAKDAVGLPAEPSFKYSDADPFPHSDSRTATRAPWSLYPSASPANSRLATAHWPSRSRLMRRLGRCSHSRWTRRASATPL